jgi:hypothetical protein
MQTQVTDGLHGFRDYEVQRVRRDIAFMREAQSADLSSQKADFYRFFSEHDRRRATNFAQSFPEMKTFWAECESHARTA